MIWFVFGCICRLTGLSVKYLQAGNGFDEFEIALGALDTGKDHVDII